MTQHDFLAIPEVAAAGLKEWRPLKGGLTNETLLLETGQGRWVLRYNLPAPGVDREREQRALAVATHLGLVPTIVACRPASGYLLTEYCVDAPWRRSDVVDAPRLEVLTRRLRELHESPIGASAMNP